MRGRPTEVFCGVLSCSGAQALLHMLPVQGLLASTTCVSGMIIDPVACSCIASDPLLSSQPGQAVMQATELVSGQAQPSTRAAQVWLQKAWLELYPAACLIQTLMLCT